MQDLVSESWRLRGPLTGRHVGGLAWSAYHIAGREHEWALRLWDQDGRVVAWGWIRPPAALELQFDPDRPALLHEVLDWFEAETGGAPERTTAAVVEDARTVALLEERGYRRAGPEEPYFACLLHGLEDLAQPTVPDGFAVRSVRDGELERRVAVHQAAWHPSRVTLASFRDVTSAYPYAADLDCVVEAPDGSLAASCLAWLDPRAGVGELEPVGTDPRFGRRGLAGAACLLALHRLRSRGACAAVVFARGDPGYPGPKRLYESIGFRPVANVVTFRAA
jgi:ribosomal protein S18 acetylase RimI-like enzyme